MQGGHKAPVPTATLQVTATTWVGTAQVSSSDRQAEWTNYGFYKQNDIIKPLGSPGTCCYVGRSLGHHGEADTQSPEDSVTWWHCMRFLEGRARSRGRAGWSG